MSRKTERRYNRNFNNVFERLGGKTVEYTLRDTVVDFEDGKLGSSFSWRDEDSRLPTFLRRLERAAKKKLGLNWTVTQEGTNLDTRLTMRKYPHITLGRISAVVEPDPRCRDRIEKMSADLGFKPSKRATYQVYSTWLLTPLRGRKLGMEGYHITLDALQRNYPDIPAVVMSNSCGSGSTSSDATRVWQKLVQNYPGFCQEALLAKPTFRCAVVVKPRSQRTTLPQKLNYKLIKD